MHAVLPILMVLVFGQPTFAAMTALDWTLFGLNVVSNAPKAIKTERQLIAFMNSPAFRAWVARNGELTIKMYPGNATY